VLTESESLTAFDKKEVRHHAEDEYHKKHRCHNQVDDGSHHEADRASNECGEANDYLLRYLTALGAISGVVIFLLAAFL
jgi:hypothetical protein